MIYILCLKSMNLYKMCAATAATAATQNREEKA